MKVLIIILSLFCIGFSSIAQTYTIDQGGTITTCTGTIYDSGDSGSDYSSNENSVMTFCPANPGDCIALTFNSIDIENGWDFLRIYDGVSTSAPRIVELTGTTNPGSISGTSGCLTLEFTSDASVTAAGWEATITCGTCATCSDGIQNGGETGIDCGGSCPNGCPGTTCADANIITALPFNQTNFTTNGAGDDYNSSNSCGSSYMNGDDYVFSYTPPTDICADIVLTNTDTWTGLFVLDGCPDAGGNCLYSDQQSGGNPSVSEMYLTAGVTYYIVVSTFPSPQFTPFDINFFEITCPTCNDGIQNGTETGVDCGGTSGGVTCPNCPCINDVITGIPYTGTGLSTCTSGNNFNANSACGSTYMTGGDYVIELTPSTSDNVIISVSNTGGSATGVFLLDACPDVTGANCIDYTEDFGGEPIIFTNLVAGNTYYVVVSTDSQWSSSACTDFDIYIGPMPPPSEQDCFGAIPICQNVYSETDSYVGDGNIPNEIDGGPSCLGGGETNGVWYTFTVQQAGDLCFSITPNDITDDYDWAVYDLTNNPCTDIYSNPALEISCNFSGASGVTGANGLAGGQNNPCVPVAAGSTFALFIDNWSGSSNGYTIDLGATTAIIFDNVGPSIDSLTANCAGDSLFISFSEWIDCSGFTSTVPFSVDGSNSSVSQFSAVGCDIGAGRDKEFYVVLDPPLGGGSYSFDIESTFTIKDLCNNSLDSASYNTSFQIPVDISVLPEQICLFDTSALLGLEVIGGIPPLTIEYNGQTILNDSIYPNTGTNKLYITDSLGCRDSSEISVYWMDSLKTFGDTTILIEDSTLIGALISQDVIYTWTPSGTIDSANIAYPVAFPDSTTLYTVNVTDTNGCTQTASVIVQTIYPDVFVPTAFSPNNDDLNDLFKVYGRGFISFSLNVYDRWGNRVYSSTDPEKGWDGTFNDVDLNPGVFMYTFTGQLRNGTVVKKTDNVTLYR